MSAAPFSVVCPYTKLQPATERLLRRYQELGGWPLRFVKLDGGDGYRRLLRELWEDGEATIIVEHDILPWPGAIEELAACPGAWCAHSYEWNGGVGVYHMLGCAKLGAELKRRVPRVWHEPLDWSLCDRHLYFAAYELEIEPHPHRPAVIHLNGLGLDASS